MKSPNLFYLLTSIVVLEPTQSLAFGFGKSKALSDRIPRQLEVSSIVEEGSIQSMHTRRKMLFSSLVSLTTIVGASSSANARVVLNDEGDYVEVTDEDWQTAWKQRLDKASSMSKDEIFNAARGAGNLELKDGEESDPSKKRRAMSACRDSTLRSKAGVNDSKTCNSRVMGGDFDFILGQL
mmetsp:Transcript_23949/g.35513  ORF Transcript_23949/g.35513 Transcript_23949/m.35513 type:complete len:181 (+) Transcript_23949:69-611(+)